MKLHKTVLDIATRLVHLNSPVYGKVIRYLPMISHIKMSLHHMVELKLEEIHVIQEFSDVFLNDLPEMPPERAIEFKIELQLGIAPTAKSLYGMTSVELADSTTRLTCSAKAIFAQVHHLGVVQCCLYQRRIKSFVYLWIIAR
jgi:hypothetical protein